MYTHDDAISGHTGSSYHVPISAPDLHVFFLEYRHSHWKCLTHAHTARVHTVQTPVRSGGCRFRCEKATKNRKKSPRCDHANIYRSSPYKSSDWHTGTRMLALGNTHTHLISGHRSSSSQVLRVVLRNAVYARGEAAALCALLPVGRSGRLQCATHMFGARAVAGGGTYAPIYKDYPRYFIEVGFWEVRRKLLCIYYNILRVVYH